MNPQLLSDVIAQCVQQFPVDRPTLLVAVSGGLDSTVLLHACAQTGARVVAVHINHNLRERESELDELFVQSLCNSLDVEFFVRSVNVLNRAKESGQSIEMAARTLRYEAFVQVSQELAADAVVMAHHANDVAETMLMNLCRGRGLAGLSSIPAQRTLQNGIPVIRPFIQFSKQQLLQYANHFGLEWREDSSNTSTEFLRNRIRSEVLPILEDIYGGSVVKNISGSARIISEANTLLRDTVYSQHYFRFRQLSNDWLSINIEELEQEPEYVVRGIFAQFLKSRHDAEQLTWLLHADTGTEASLQGARIALRDRNTIIIGPQNSQLPVLSLPLTQQGVFRFGNQSLRYSIENAIDVQPSFQHSIAYLDAARLKGSLTWRTWLPADRMTPLGAKHTAKISDLLTNAKVNSWQRKSATVVEDQEGIVWLCGLRVAERCRISHTTQNIVVLQLAT